MQKSLPGFHEISPVPCLCSCPAATLLNWSLSWSPPWSLDPPTSSCVWTYLSLAPNKSKQSNISWEVLQKKEKCIVWYHQKEDFSRLTISMTILRRVCRCFFDRFWKMSQFSPCRSLKPTAKWWFSRTDSSLYMSASSESASQEESNLFIKTSKLLHSMLTTRKELNQKHNIQFKIKEHM